MKIDMLIQAKWIYRLADPSVIQISKLSGRTCGRCGSEGKGPERGSAYSKEEPIIVKGLFVQHVLAIAGIVGWGHLDNGLHPVVLP